MFGSFKCLFNSTDHLLLLEQEAWKNSSSNMQLGDIVKKKNNNAANIRSSVLLQCVQFRHFRALYLGLEFVYE